MPDMLNTGMMMMQAQHALHKSMHTHHTIYTTYENYYMTNTENITHVLIRKCGQKRVFRGKRGDEMWKINVSLMEPEQRNP